MAKLTFVVRVRKEPTPGAQYIVHMKLSHRSTSAYIDTGLRVGVSGRPGNYRVNFSDDAQMITREEYGYIYKNDRLSEMLNRSYEVLANIPNAAMLDVNTLADYLRGEGVEESARMKTVLSECKRYLAVLEERHNGAEVVKGPRGGTRRLGAEYVTNFIGMMDDWEKMMGDMTLEMVTPRVISRWADKLSRKIVRGRNISPVTVGKKIGQLRSVFRYLEREGTRMTIDPFSQFHQPRHPRVEKAIDLEALRTWHEHTPMRNGGRAALDLFWLSFYSGGMDYADLIRIDWRKDLVKYTRQKVQGRGDEVVVPVGDKMRELLNKYIDPKTGLLPWNYLKCRSMAQTIKREGGLAGMPDWFSYKSARKTFAQLAMSLRFTDAEIDYLLGHSERKRGIIFHYNSVGIDDARVLLNAVAMMVEDDAAARKYVAEKRGWI